MATEKRTTKIRSKKELAQYYGISSSSLRVLMNVEYYDELVAVGYKKDKSHLSPHVVRLFIEIWGKQLNDEDI